MGRGLLSYFLHYYRDGVGVWGYDPILGAFTPPLRLRFHLVEVMVAWAVMLGFWPVSVIPDTCIANMGIPLSVVQACVVALASYLVLQYIINFVLPAVSHPGGPRPHKIQRIPKWNDTMTILPDFALKKWRCTVADESHEVSKEKFAGTNAKITGQVKLCIICWVHSPIYVECILIGGTMNLFTLRFLKNLVII